MFSELKKKLLGAGIIFLFTFVLYSSQIFILWRYFGSGSLETVLVLVPFNILASMVYVNFFLTSLTDGGTIPTGWFFNSGMSSTKETPPLCHECRQYKPPRSHHCRICNRCVLKMDHHCPWFNGCIGHFNYGHFIRFLTYLEATIIFAFVPILCRLINVGQTQGVDTSTIEMCFIVVDIVILFFILIFVTLLLGFHITLIIFNCTTIEYAKNSNLFSLKNLRRQSIYKNICAVLGPQPLLWFWPQKMQGNGIEFDHSRESLDSLSEKAMTIAVTTPSKESCHSTAETLVTGSSLINYPERAIYRGSEETQIVSP